MFICLLLGPYYPWRTVEKVTRQCVLCTFIVARAPADVRIPPPHNRSSAQLILRLSPSGVLPYLELALERSLLTQKVPLYNRNHVASRGVDEKG